MYLKSATSNLGRGYAVTLKRMKWKSQFICQQTTQLSYCWKPSSIMRLALVHNHMSIKGAVSRLPSSSVYLSNRPHFLWVYWRDNNAGRLENTRKAYKSPAEGEWFTSFLSVLPTSILAVRCVISMNTTEKECFEFVSRKSLSDSLNGH